MLVANDSNIGWKLLIWYTFEKSGEIWNFQDFSKASGYVIKEHKKLGYNKSLNLLCAWVTSMREKSYWIGASFKLLICLAQLCPEPIKGPGCRSIGRW